MAHSIRASRFIWGSEDVVVEKAVARLSGYQRHIKELERRMVGLQASLAKAKREKRSTDAIERSIKSLQARIDLV